MPLNPALFSEDLDNMIGDMPATLFYKGKPIAVAATDLGKPLVFEETVTSYERDISITGNLGDFPNLPLSEEKCLVRVFNSKISFRCIITNVKVHQDNVGVELMLRADQDSAGDLPS